MRLLSEQGKKKKVSTAATACALSGLIVMSSKYFSRHEAEELLPLIEGFLTVAQEHKQTADAAQMELTNAASRIMVLGGSYPPYSDLIKKKTERDQASGRIVEAIARIQDTGCLVKDIDEGLIDFPSMIEGQEAFLCWKQGEGRIEFWHGLEDGFAGRKRLDGSPADGPPPGSSRVQ